MTAEESKALWSLEKSKINEDNFTKPMKKMYKILDKAINEDVITYENFTEDVLNELTTMMVQEGKNELKIDDRLAQVDLMCERLTNKYEEQYNSRKSELGDTELQTNNLEVQDELGVCESTSITETSGEYSTEIN